MKMKIMWWKKLLLLEKRIGFEIDNCGYWNPVWDEELGSGCVGINHIRKRYETRMDTWSDNKSIPICVLIHFSKIIILRNYLSNNFVIFTHNIGNRSFEFFFQWFTTTHTNTKWFINVMNSDFWSNI